MYYHAADKLVSVLPCRAVTLQYNLVNCAASVYFLQEGAEGGGNIWCPSAPHARDSNVCGMPQAQTQSDCNSSVCRGCSSLQYLCAEELWPGKKGIINIDKSDMCKRYMEKTTAKTSAWWCRKLFQILRIKMHYRSIKRPCCRSKHAATIVGSLLSWSLSCFFCYPIALYSCLWLSNCCHSSAVSPAGDFSLDSNSTHTLHLSCVSVCPTW